MVGRGSLKVNLVRLSELASLTPVCMRKLTQSYAEMGSEDDGLRITILLMAADDVEGAEEDGPVGGLIVRSIAIASVLPEARWRTLT